MNNPIAGFVVSITNITAAETKIMVGMLTPKMTQKNYFSAIGTMLEDYFDFRCGILHVCHLGFIVEHAMPDWWWDGNSRKFPTWQQLPDFPIKTECFIKVEGSKYLLEFEKVFGY